MIEEEFPGRLYGARFLSGFFSNVSKTNYKIDEYICINEYDDYALYYLSNDEHHTYKISRDLKVLETSYRLEDELDQKAIDKMEDMYYGQSEWKFSYNEENSLESYADEVYGDMFGYIMYPNMIFTNKIDANLFIQDKLIEEFTKLNDSNSRTITMYTDDNTRASKSFENIVSDSITVNEPIIGTKFYKYVTATGVLTYEVIELLEFDGSIMYKLLCTCCNHSAPCEIIVSKIMSDSYSLVKICGENDHKHFHISESFFHTSKKTAYQEYLSKIKDYNEKVLNHFREKKHIYELVINLANK